MNTNNYSRPICGPHINSLTQQTKEDIAKFKPKYVKLLHTAFSADFVRQYDEQICVLRYVFGDENDSDLIGKTRKAIDFFKGVANTNSVLEVPLNEADQNGDALSRYADLTIQVLPVIRDAGFIPAIGNFSTGNPPDISDGVRRFLPALSAGHTAGAYLSLHEYWRADQLLDGWNPLRYRKFYALLPDSAKLPLLITEGGLDRIFNTPTRGWRTYGKDANWYYNQLRAYAAEIGRDDYVKAFFLFCNGQFGDWWDFDTAGEDDINRIYSDQFLTDTFDLPDITLSFPVTNAFTLANGGPRRETRNIFIHSSRSGVVGNAPDREAASTSSYFQAPDGDSSQLVVGDTVAFRNVGDDNISYHATENNAWGLGIEVAQATPTTPYTANQYFKTAEIVRKLCDKYNIPKVRITSQTVKGIIGHEDSEQGKRFGKSDPGPMWDWSYFLSLVRQSPTPTPQPPSDPFNIGEGFRNLIRKNGWTPLSDETYTSWGSTAVARAAGNKLAFMAYRKYTNEVKWSLWDTLNTA